MEIDHDKVKVKGIAIIYHIFRFSGFNSEMSQVK